MHSVNIKGKVLDFYYKKRELEGNYSFYIGDIFIGQVFNMGRYWSCVSGKPHEFSLVDGFKTRFHASVFMLRLQGYWRR